MRRRHVLTLVTLLVVAVVVATGCSSGDDNKKSSDGNGVTVTTEKGVPVAIEVGETSDTEQYMRVTPATVPAGAVTFTLTNKGEKDHEFMVLETDTPFDELEISADDTVDESGRVGDEAEADAGETATVTIDLEAGTYVLVCNKKGHYGKGMRAEFTVT